MKRKLSLGILSLLMVFALAACGGNITEDRTQDDENQKDIITPNGTNGTNEEETEETEIAPEDMKTEENDEENIHSHMNKEQFEEVPPDVKAAENPKFPVGSKVTIVADHIKGIKGAEGTITGAYDTTAYEVSYSPTDGGEEVKNYKWLIHEQLDGASGAPMEPGIDVIINADHMEGMQGASAKVVSSQTGTIYMVDFTTTTGEKMTNHQWFTESELTAQ